MLSINSFALLPVVDFPFTLQDVFPLFTFFLSIEEPSANVISTTALLAPVWIYSDFISPVRAKVMAFRIDVLPLPFCPINTFKCSGTRVVFLIPLKFTILIELIFMFVILLLFFEIIVLFIE